MTNRPCEKCGTPAPYEPIMLLDKELTSFPHLCDACSEAASKADEKAAAEAHAKATRERREKIWRELVPDKYRKTDILHPDFPARLWESLRHCNLRESVGLIGPAGRCKTRLLALLAKRAIAGDESIGWCPATGFQWAAQRQWSDTDGKEARKWLRQWQKCQILFLDDLGKHRWTEAVEAELFALIDLHSSQGKPIHWTLNPLPADEAGLVELMQQDPVALLARALDPSGEAGKRPRFAPIVSRLLDGTKLVPVI